MALELITLKEFLQSITIAGMGGLGHDAIALGAILVITLLVSNIKEDYLQTLLGTSLILPFLGLYINIWLQLLFIIIMAVSVIINTVGITTYEGQTG